MLHERYDEGQEFVLKMLFLAQTSLITIIKNYSLVVKFYHLVLNRKTMIIIISYYLFHKENIICGNA
jgi:hypothetical protein